MTIIYFMRHSEALKPLFFNSNDSLQLQNEKWVLSIKGENIAREKSEVSELQKIDVVYSSNYVRAIATAKYFTNDEILIDGRFGERRFGVNNWDELPYDFEKKQWENFDYKLDNGESLNEVVLREESALNDILNKYRGKKILIVGHSTAIASLFSKWCDVSFMDSYKYHNREFFDGKWGFCETFRLDFDDNNNLINIENIR